MITNNQSRPTTRTERQHKRQSRGDGELAYYIEKATSRMNVERDSPLARKGLRLGKLLLGLAGLLLGLALHLLALVTSDGADNVVDLARDLVLGALGVLLGLGGLDLALTLGVLLLAGLLPLGRTESVTDGLLDGTGDRVVVTVKLGRLRHCE